MNMLKNARVGVRLYLGFGVTILLLIVLSTIARMKMGTLADLTAMLYQHPFTVSTHLISAEADIIRMERGIKDVLLAGDPAELDAKITAIDNAEKDVNEHLETVGKFYLGDKQDVEAVIKELKAWKPYREKTIELMKTNLRIEAVEWHKTKASPQIAKMEEKFVIIEEFAAKKAAFFVKGAQETAGATYSLIYILVFLAVVVSLAIATFTSRSITRPLNKAVDVANRIAGGDLNVTLPSIEQRDEVGELIVAFDRMTQYLKEMAGVAGRIAGRDLKAQVEPQSAADVLGNAFATMIDNLRSVMTEIQESASVVASSVGEILVTTTQVASGIAETATSVSETTATVEEVKQTAQLSAEKSRDVSENAQAAALVAEQGHSAVTETIDGIGHIKELMATVAESVVMLSEQTQAIDEIITVVGDLAQQSNLLAVNAAIEASKAGEQGKGFTVVAQEIKSLADQSKQATEQVRAILGDIQKATGKSVLAAEQVSKAVEGGVKQAAASGESIGKLAGNIGAAAQAAAQIAASSQQQLAGMEQVAMAMESIKQAAQQNVSGTRQAEQAAHTLNELGQKLKEMVEKYKV
jgi:methyl-accepting chemotaxis protein